jgi:quercetin dioxygenase-like cupin family protein
VTMKAGEVYENPVTGERVVIRVGTEECGGELLVADLYVKPDGASMGEHVHPGIEEGFTVVRGRLGYRLGGREGVVGPGQHLHVPHGTTHDWWNAGEEKARIVVEISPAARFEEMIKNLWGLAQDGKTDAKGRPRLLQAALFAREFDDIIRLTKPPRPVQRLLFGALAPVARLLGYRGSYPEYLRRPPREVVELEPWRDFSAWPLSTDRGKEVDEEAIRRS